MKAKHSGFTLIELVVVIMILGILAGVAAPKLLNVSGDATDNGLKQTLSIVRDAIELFAAENGGALPTCLNDGTGTGNFHEDLAPYLRGDTFPICPIGTTGTTKNNLISPTSGASTTADSSPTAGWMFNTDDGTFICNEGTGATSNGTVYSAL